MRKRPTFLITIIVAAVAGFVVLTIIGISILNRNTEVKIVENQEPEVLLLTDIKEVEVEKKVGIYDRETDVDVILKRYVPNLDKEANNFTPDHTNERGVVEAGSITISSPSTIDNNYIINDPKVESLLKEAFSFYVNGDMVKAVGLLEEAKLIDSNEPAVLDLEAQIAEDIGAIKKARQLYLQIHSFGVSAGSYYRRASYKLTKGIGNKIDDWAVLMFGSVNIDRGEEGRFAELTIPVRSKEGETIIPTLIEIQVNLYDLVNGKKIEPAAKNSIIESVWLDSVRDWSDTGEESIRVKYTIPRVDSVMEHLYGQRKYHGQVVELYYKGELQDIIAHPRKLVKQHAKLNYTGDNSQFLSVPQLDDFNEFNPLLPKLDE